MSNHRLKQLTELFVEVMYDIRCTFNDHLICITTSTTNMQLGEIVHSIIYINYISKLSSRHANNNTNIQNKTSSHTTYDVKHSKYESHNISSYQHTICEVKINNTDALTKSLTNEWFDLLAIYPQGELLKTGGRPGTE